MAKGRSSIKHVQSATSFKPPETPTIQSAIEDRPMMVMGMVALIKNGSDKRCANQDMTTGPAVPNIVSTKPMANPAKCRIEGLS